MNKSVEENQTALAVADSIPREQSLGAMFRYTCLKLGPNPAQWRKRDGAFQMITFNRFYRVVIDLALGFTNIGVERGDKVAILSENRPEWAYVDLAALSLGAVVVPIYLTNTLDQVTHILRDSDATVVAVSNRTELTKVRICLSDLPNIKKVIVFDEEVGMWDSKTVPLTTLLRIGRNDSDKASFKRLLSEVQPDDVASYVYTSGTTGVLKGVMLTHRNMIENVKAASKSFTLSNEDICLSFLPLAHSLERVAGYYNSIYHGVQTAYAEGIKKLGANILEVRPTLIASVPVVYENIYNKIISKVQQAGGLKQKIFNFANDNGRAAVELKLAKAKIPFWLKLKWKIGDILVFKKIRKLLGGRLRFFFSGGATLPAEVAKFFYAARVIILEGYGLTEAAPGLTVNTPDDITIGTVGKPLYNVEIKLAADGEILAKGPNIMIGYHNLPKETEESFTEDGWLKTGDIGEFNETGHLIIKDRKKDIIVLSKGENVAPNRVENTLTLDPLIAQVLVFGDKRNSIGAIIVPDYKNLRIALRKLEKPVPLENHLHRSEDVQILIEEAVSRANLKLTHFERVGVYMLKRGAFTAENQALTATLKLRRRVLLKRYHRVIERLYQKADKPKNN